MGKRLRQRPAVDFMQRGDRRRLGAGIKMVVNIHRLEAHRLFRQLEGFDHALETVKRPVPVIGIDILVLVRCKHLIPALLAHALRRNFGPGFATLGNHRISTVHVQVTVQIHLRNGRRQGHAIAGPEENFGFFPGRHQGGVNVIHRPLDLTLQVETVIRNVQRVRRLAFQLRDIRGMRVVHRIGP